MTPDERGTRATTGSVVGGEALVAAQDAMANETYVFRLYVTGTTPKSLRAITNLKKFCDEFFPGRSQVEVIDMYEEPERASQAQVVVSPTLVKDAPLPIRRLLGDLSDRQHLMAALAILVKPEEEHAA